MKDPETATVFAGLDGRTDAKLPEWYADRHGVTDPLSFSEAVRDLPQAIDTAVAYRNPYTDEWVETERFNAIVEPSRLQAAEGDAEEEALFHIPTDSYAIINPVDVYGPLEEVLREETIDGTPLGDVMFGEIRRYRGGGEVHMDIMFDGLEVQLPGRVDPITMGVTSGYDFFGEHAVYVEGFAQDGYCSNSMRSLTDKEVIKHVGDDPELVDSRTVTVPAGGTKQFELVFETYPVAQDDSFPVRVETGDSTDQRTVLAYGTEM